MTLNLEEQEQLAKFKSFWNGGGKWLFAFVLLASLLFLGFQAKKRTTKIG